VAVRKRVTASTLPAIVAGVEGATTPGRCACRGPSTTGADEPVFAAKRPTVVVVNSTENHVVVTSVPRTDLAPGRVTVCLLRRQPPVDAVRRPRPRRRHRLRVLHRHHRPQSSRGPAPTTAHAGPGHQVDEVGKAAGATVRDTPTSTADHGDQSVVDQHRPTVTPPAPERHRRSHRHLETPSPAPSAVAGNS
jgi:hypothetical protein